MDKQEREALQVTKEIVVKFIEIQRLSPSNIKEVFPAIHKVVLDSIRHTQAGPAADAEADLESDQDD